MRFAGLGNVQLGQSIFLPDFEVPTFDRFVQWLYHKTINVPQTNVNDRIHDNYMDLTKLYLLADNFKVTALQDGVMERLFEMVQMSKKPPTLDLASFVYNSTTETSRLRKFLSAIYAFKCKVDHLRFSLTDGRIASLPPAFVRDIVVTMAEKLRSHGRIEFHLTDFLESPTVDDSEAPATPEIGSATPKIQAKLSELSLRTGSNTASTTSISDSSPKPLISSNKEFSSHPHPNPFSAFSGNTTSGVSPFGNTTPGISPFGQTTSQTAFLFGNNTTSTIPSINPPQTPFLFGNNTPPTFVPSTDTPQFTSFRDPISQPLPSPFGGSAPRMNPFFGDRTSTTRVPGNTATAYYTSSSAEVLPSTGTLSPEYRVTMNREISFLNDNQLELCCYQGITFMMAYESYSSEVSLFMHSE